MSPISDHRLPSLKPLSMRRPTTVSVLDIGTSKMTCIIARLVPRMPGDVLPRRSHNIEVLGFGMQRSRGIRAYGLLPFRLNYYDAAGIHSVNERMRIDWFEEGVETVKRIVLEAATTPAPQIPMR